MEQRRDGSSLRHHIHALTVFGWIEAACMTIRTMVQEGMFLGQTISIAPGLFSLRYVRNPGAAFGLLSTVPEAFRLPLFMAVGMLALVARITMYIKDGHESWRSRIGLASVAGARHRI